MTRLPRILTLASAAGILVASPAFAQNDECTTATTLALGSIPFDTTLATQSPEIWPCASNGGPDLWYEYTAPNTNVISFDTCGSSYDTALEAFSGTCGGLISLTCNDDACALQSTITVAPTAAGDVFYVRVGGFAGNVGTGTLTVVEIPPVMNDDCATAIPLVAGTAAAYDTSGATLSPVFNSCIAMPGPDVWYSYTTTSTNTLRIETCGSILDTALEGFSGTCGALVSVDCNDQFCGNQSRISIAPTAAGQTYYIQVSGWNGAVGQGTIVVTELPPPVQGCVVNPGFETGDTAGWNFSEYVTPFVPASVNGPGASNGFGLFATAPTEGNFSFLCGFDAAGPDILTLAQSVQVSSGLTPLTFDYRAGWDMLNFGGSTLDRTFDVVVRDPNTGAALQTTNILTATAGTLNLDTGSMPGSVDLSMFLGQTVVVSFEVNIPQAFTGPAQLEIDNISCPSGGGAIGVNYCGPAVINSSGSSAIMSATGSRVVTANDLTLVATDMPQNSFAFFLTSQAQGFVPMPGGSLGNLCLGGMIGRYVGAGQIQNSGMMGEVSLLLDLTQTPQPMGFVSIGAGETWSFQCWFRDAVGGTAVSNFSDGLEITFL